MHLLKTVFIMTVTAAAPMRIYSQTHELLIHLLKTVFIVTADASMRIYSMVT